MCRSALMEIYRARQVVGASLRAIPQSRVVWPGMMEGLAGRSCICDVYGKRAGMQLARRTAGLAGCMFITTGRVAGISTRRES